ncbi:MAG: pyridoxal phosphate-dependent aminotransferase, partial [Bacteroidales bacterium]|nr:pyridoxal phosphate-dependent aminotransferase [Bacteroidales bacterium]
AFNCVAKLPVKNADNFCAWLLSDFRYEDATLFLAPMSGFYTAPGYGDDEVRIAYVLEKEDLAKSIEILELALIEYHKKS